jgi:hypothetical protein
LRGSVDEGHAGPMLACTVVVPRVTLVDDSHHDIEVALES